MLHRREHDLDAADPAALERVLATVSVAGAVAQEYVQNYVQGGKILIKHQAVAVRLADMIVRVEAVRALLDRASAAVDENAPDAELRSHVMRVLEGQYDVDKEIGRGGMGIVYKGRDQRLKRPVAIKIMRQDQALDAEFRLRFSQGTDKPDTQFALTAADFKDTALVVGSTKLNAEQAAWTKQALAAGV